MSAVVRSVAPLSLHAAEASPSTPPVNTNRPIKPLNAWAAAGLLTPGTNIGNTFDSTGAWETGWGHACLIRTH